MDDRYDRARCRVITRLCHAAYFDFEGLTRSTLADVADHNNYRRGSTDLERMIAEGDLERNPRHGKKYRLTLQTIDEVAYTDDNLVADFFDLNKPYARELRLQRIAARGRDVILPPARYGVTGEPRFPRYNIDPFYGLSEDEVLEIVGGAKTIGEIRDGVENRERKRNFWSTPDPDSTPELADFWA